MDFYSKFEQLCQSKGVTFARVREELGISQSTMASWKSRGLTPKYETAKKLADYFGVTVDYLLGLNEMQKDIAAFVESPGEWVSQVKTNEGVIVLPAEFNEFERFIEKIGYRTTLDNKGQYWIEGNGKRTAISVADLMNLVRSSRATVGALAQSLIDKPPDDTHPK